MTKKIAFIAKNPKNKFSGGRIYALTMAKAFSELGFDVDYYTNTKPIFYNDLVPSDSNSRINLIINNYFLFTPVNKKYDAIFLIPHLNTVRNNFFDRLFFYGFAMKMKSINKSKLFFIDFESPNWVNTVNDKLRSNFAYINSDRIIKKVDSVISISKTGQKYAKEYYSLKNSSLEFNVLYPPINSTEADKIKNINKTNSVVFFARFDGNHKAPEALFMVIKSLPKGFKLNIITNKKFISQEILTEMIELSTRKGIVIDILDRINDLEKYKYLAESKLLVFSSKFEGFGLPPVEAQYMNTPVICSDLPILREVNKKAIFDDFNSLSSLKNKINMCLDSPPNDLKESVVSFAKFESFVKNLKQII